MLTPSLSHLGLLGGDTNNGPSHPTHGRGGGNLPLLGRGILHRFALLSTHLNLLALRYRMPIVEVVGCGRSRFFGPLY